jgi:monoterpene epsilon-lactone hydrolase
VSLLDFHIYSRQYCVHFCHLYQPRKRIMQRIPSQSHSIVKIALNKLLPLMLGLDRASTQQQLLEEGENLDKIGRMTPLPVGVKKKTFMVNRIECELLTPRKPKDGLLFYIHGGGYCMGSVDSHRSLVGYLAKKLNRQAIVFSYRKAPVHPFPAAIDDALEVYQWVLRQGYNPHEVVFAGDSAGGGMTLSLLKRNRELGLPQPAAACCISPWVDKTLSGDSMELNKANELILSEGKLKLFADNYCGDVARNNPKVSPLFGDFSDLPPTLF